MKKLLIISLFLMLQVSAFSQMAEYDQDYFINPTDYEIVLAGSFAELRTTHFHAGIDIKPKSPTGIDTIRAAADGYVSRIKIQTGGYGQALYIDHPNGYTTVYAHLKAFDEEISSYIDMVQKKTRSYTLDIYPDSTRFYFQKGQPIGLMGNTGRSFAKHLHFEIRETETEIPVNPGLFGVKPSDNRFPSLISVDIHRLTPDYHEQQSNTYYPQKTADGNYTINGGKVSFPAWICGISTQSYDQMNGASNRNGVYYQYTYVDDSLVHAFVLDKVSFDESKFINSHVDYKTRIEENRTCVRSYILPGNELSVYKNVKDQGLIKLFKDVSRKVKIVLGDIEGNETMVIFDIVREEKEPEQKFHSYNQLIRYGTADTVSAFGMQMIFPRKALDRDLYISYKKENDLYTVGNPSDVLFQSVALELPVGTIPDSLMKYVGIHQLNEDEWINCGGIIKEGKIKTYTSSLGAFKIGLDTLPPTIVLSENILLAPGKKIKAKMDDNIAAGGIASEIKYEVLLDGQWLVAPYKIMTRQLSFTIPPDIEKGEHVLEIKCTDHHNNQTVLRRTFTI
jgi:hypothetical protein